MPKVTRAPISPAATAACGQLRSLTAQGYPAGWLADYTALSEQTVTRVRSGRARLLQPRIAFEIASAFLLLNGIDPAEHGITPEASHIALLQAARSGWTAGSGAAA